MNIYEGTVRYKKKKINEENEERALFPTANCEKPSSFYKDAFRTANDKLGVRCDDKGAFSFFFCEAEKGKARFIFAVDTDKSDEQAAETYLKEFLEDKYDVCNVELLNVSEITTERFHKAGDRADDLGYIRRFSHDEDMLHLDFRSNREYRIKEELVSSEKMGLDEASAEAKKFMADQSLIEELERIYSNENEKKYYGNPVHYKISASNMESAMLIVNLLAHALKVNNRLSGSRLNRIFDIKEGCYDERDFENMFTTARGNIVLFDLSGSISAFRRRTAPRWKAMRSTRTSPSSSPARPRRCGAPRLRRATSSSSRAMWNCS